MRVSIYKKSILFILLGIVFIFGSSNSVLAQSQYSNPTGHYSFTLPSEWMEIPKSVINQAIDEVVRQTQGQRIEYTTGFQLAEKDYFQYPYILVQEHVINTPSYSQLESVFNNGNFQSSVQQEMAEYSELLTNATIEKPFVDRERNIIFMNMQLDVANIGKATGLTAIFLGK